VNWPQKIEEVVKPLAIIAAFLILLLFAFGKEAKADVSIEIGPTFLSGEYADGQVLTLNEQFDNGYSVGVGYITKQVVTDRDGNTFYLRENVFVQAMRHVDVTGKFNLGLGVGYVNGTNRALGSKFVFSLLVRYDFTDRWSANIRHFSNAGSSPPNMGQDMLTIGYSFGGK